MVDNDGGERGSGWMVMEGREERKGERVEGRRKGEDDRRREGRTGGVREQREGDTHTYILHMYSSSCDYSHVKCPPIHTYYTCIALAVIIVM